jgi:hypothetical protein
MPCYSTITQTTMTDERRLADALRALGYTAAMSGHIVSGSGPDLERISFERNTDFASRSKTGAFSTTSTNLDAIRAVQRKYSELTVREFARRKGFTIQSEGNTLTLINRRGG